MNEMEAQELWAKLMTNPGVYVKSGKMHAVLYHKRKTYRAGKSFPNKTEEKKWREEKLRELERGIDIDTENIAVAGFIPHILSVYTEDTGTHTTYKSDLNTLKISPQNCLLTDTTITLWPLTCAS